MKNVLVIGGTGFIGGHLVDNLCQNGFRVSALVRENSDTKQLESLGVKLLTGDLLDLDSLMKIISTVDTVFCLVNLKPIGKSQQEYEEELFKLHIDGTKNLVKTCRAKNVRSLVYLSSVAAIGYEKNVNVYDESSELHPKDSYGKAKLEAENILNEASKDAKLDITILRPPGVFGERGLGALSKIIKFVEKGVVPVLGNGKNRQSLTYVGNVINQIVWVAENQNAAGKTYIVSDENPYSVNELIDAVCKVANKRALRIHIPVSLTMFGVIILNFIGRIILKREIMSKESIIAISTERVFNGSKIFKELEYRQQYDLATSVKRTFDWHEKQNG
jgi:nucleoside-diphosphate-sugar epimerase